MANHFLRAGDARAAEWLVRAGERAQLAYAWPTAVERYEAALALMERQGGGPGERAWLLFRLALLRRYDRPGEGIAALDEAERRAAEAGDRALAACARFYRGQLRAYSGAVRAAIPEMEAGVAALDALGSGEQARFRALAARRAATNEVSPHGVLAAWLADVGRYAEAGALGERVAAEEAAARDGGGLTASAYADAHLALATTYAPLGRPEEARRESARARAGYRARENHFFVGWATMWELERVTLPYRADDLAERERLAREAEQAWALAARGQASVMPRQLRLGLLLLGGDWAEARHLAAAAQASQGLAERRQWGALALATLARSQGEAELVLALVREWLPQGPATSPGDSVAYYVQSMQRLAALVAIDAGDLPTARAWLAAHDRWLEWSGAVLGQAEGHLGWAAYHRAAGDLTLARQHAEQALVHATEPRQPLALLAAHRLLGELDTTAGDDAQAQAHLDQALALADACAAPYERALTLLALAELHAATGKQDDARAVLDEVRAILTPLDAKPTLARADALATKLAEAQQPRERYPAGLTAREVEVLGLVAQGLTNAQVAERLYVTPRTVNAHLTAVYSKLGVASRSAAVRFAHDHGLR